MARRAKATYLTTAAFIPRDDDAVGPEADYAKYLEEMDEAHLDLQGKPDRFFVRPLDQIAMDTLRVLSAQEAEILGDGEGRVYARLKDIDSSKRHILGAAHMEFHLDLVQRCVVGVDCFSYVDGVKGGQPVIESFSWPLGSGALPADKARLIASDEALIVDMMTFVTRLSTLSEDTKKP